MKRAQIDLVRITVIVILVLIGIRFVTADVIQNTYSSGDVYKLGTCPECYNRTAQKLDVSEFNATSLGFYINQGNNTNNDSTETPVNDTFNYGTTSSSSLRGIITGQTQIAQCQKVDIDNMTITQIKLDTGSASSGTYTIDVFLTMRKVSDESLLINESICYNCDDSTWEGIQTKTISPPVYVDEEVYLCSEYHDFPTNEAIQPQGSWASTARGSWCENLTSGGYVCNSTRDMYHDIEGYNETHTLSWAYNAWNVSGEANFSIRWQNNDSIIYRAPYGNASLFSLYKSPPAFYSNNTTTILYLNGSYYLSVEYAGTGWIEVWAGTVLSGEQQSNYNATAVAWNDQTNDLGYKLTGDSTAGVCSPEFRYLCTEFNCVDTGEGYWYLNFCWENALVLGGGGGNIPQETYSQLLSMLEWWKLIVNGATFQTTAFEWNPPVYDDLSDEWSDLFIGDFSAFPGRAIEFFKVFVSFLSRNPSTLVNLEAQQ